MVCPRRSLPRKFVSSRRLSDVLSRDDHPISHTIVATQKVGFYLVTRGSVPREWFPIGSVPECGSPDGQSPEGQSQTVPTARFREYRSPDGRSREGQSPQGRSPECRSPDGRWSGSRESSPPDGDQASAPLLPRPVGDRRSTSCDVVTTSASASLVAQCSPDRRSL